MIRVHAVALRSDPDRPTAAAAAVAAVERAADDGAALVVLPEYAVAFDPRGVGSDQAEPLDGPFVAGLARAAARTGVVVVAGTVLPGSRPERAVNAVVALGADGVLGVYRKVHLYDAFGHRESERLEPGDPAAAPLVVPVGDLRVGVLTCYDLRFPESARLLVDAGATVLAVPAAWAAGEHKADHWATLLRARAIENTAYVVGATQRGPGVVGGPAVVDPDGVVLAGDPGRVAADDRGRDADDGPEVAAAELDAGVVARVRERNPSLRNRRYRVVPGD
ncbi:MULTISPECIES: nitrilase-related carbon-nitrogen hydrolase [unclassified Actinotalea]|uniref:nitrilase-related carbon-nitrogen hydrolase n=1 Tax=Actinotalea sp. JY-7876 TaxID=2758442 RepID=UPI0015F4AD7E|nr:MULTISPECIES: nitrilase-related carbon-nitrogen hydrolase [unclassified Actinotalea]